MKKLIVLIIVIVAAFNVNAQKVRVAAAANLRYIMGDIKELYEKQNPEVQVDVTLGSSGALSTQILNGAQFDFYMAADKSFPDKLKAAGVTTGDVKTYAFGKLVLWSNSVDVSKGLEILNDKSVVHIAVAKPDVAPYGERAVEALKYYGLFDKIRDKIVYADNISQAAQFAVSGNAEVGMLANALVPSPSMEKTGTYFMIDIKSYKPVEQGCILVKTWERNPEAAKFMDFVLGVQCKPIFEKYGFLLP